ncbi:uncharacterized protein LDX57_009250 [Aspergillus melleus]|uniref:uncharacterized protein n=1 Tax=Aspergillus melleus TaxID=138277 RepID=UPI001E8D43B7|nr:uncharacterized protein LDX57_009250 [Aspergillus melleus]KAH8431592.1 hypothetical protein LDX57_009250 [Aspergillus melleus]
MKKGNCSRADGASLSVRISGEIFVANSSGSRSRERRNRPRDTTERVFLPGRTDGLRKNIETTNAAQETKPHRAHRGSPHSELAELPYRPHSSFPGNLDGYNTSAIFIDTSCNCFTFQTQLADRFYDAHARGLDPLHS